MEKQLTIDFFLNYNSKNTRNKLNKPAQNEVKRKNNKEYYSSTKRPLKSFLTNDKAISEIVKNINKLKQYTYLRDVYSDVLNLVLITLESWNNDDKYFEYLSSMQKKYRKENYKMFLDTTSHIFSILLQFFTYEQQFYDILGSAYMELDYNKRIGQFFTPFNVAIMMAMMNFDIDKLEQAKKENRKLTVFDPACGAGSMLLAFKQVIVDTTKDRSNLRYFKFYGNDIDLLCVTMCKIQMLLTDDIYMRDYLIIKTYEMQNKLKNRSQ